MIQQQTIVNVTDNSGAKKIMCIRVLGGSGRKIARLGDVIVATVKKAIPNGNVKKSEVVRAVIVRTRKEQGRADGSYIKFDDNAAVIINNNGEPRASRILGPVARELRAKGEYSKLISLSLEVI